MPSSIPHLGLPMVESNVRLGSQLMGEDTVEFANSLGKAHRVEIVVESKQVFTFVESLVSCCEGGMLRKLNNKGIRGSPCSPPSPWWIW